MAKTGNRPDGAGESGTADVGREIFETAPSDLGRQRLGQLLSRPVGLPRYAYRAEMARGGMGTIYLVKDQDLGRRTVVKVIRSDLAVSPRLLQRFVEEARLTAGLEHPNIVPVHDFGVLGGDRPYFSMKCVRGEELSLILHHLAEGDADYRQRYPRSFLLTAFRKVCDAVAFAHSKHVIHRDIKPDNIMVADYGEVVLMDWGLARFLRHPTASVVSRGPLTPPPEHETLGDLAALETVDGIVKGTPAYMSPEQADGRADEVDERSDIFLLGATLYHIITLSQPYPGDETADVLDAAAACSYVPPRELAPDTPRILAAIIQKAMAPRREDRYQSVVELADDLDAFTAGRLRSETHVFAPGELLMAEGDCGTDAYVIIRGEVDVYRSVAGQRVPLVRLGPGDSVGEMALISGAPRSASVQAIVETEAVLVTEATMEAGLDHLPPWLRRLVRALVDRLRESNTRAHPLLSTDFTRHVLQQLRLLYSFWARPAWDSETGGWYAVAETARTIDEIAATLCLPTERVVNVFAELFAQRLLCAWDDHYFYVPSVQLLNRFIDYLQQAHAVDSGFVIPVRTTVFAGDNELVVRHADVTDSEPELAMDPVYEATPEEALGRICDSEVELWEAFGGILDALRRVAEGPDHTPPGAHGSEGLP